MSVPAGKEIKVLLDAEKIASRVAELGEEIRATYSADDTIVVVGVLRGAFIFMADLVRAIHGPVVTDFFQCASYEGTESTGEVTIIQDVRTDLEDKHVLIVEDICDTGTTLEVLIKMFKERNPKSLRTAVLLNKPSRRTAENLTLDFVAFEIEDLFVIGYGLDLDQQYRNLPYVGLVVDSTAEESTGEESPVLEP